MNPLDKVLFNLHTLASVPKGGRISTCKEFIVIEEIAFMQGYWRWLNAESRDRAIVVICREVRTSIMFAQYISESFHLFSDNPQRIVRVAELEKIKDALAGASIGISNICYTYDEDVSGNLTPLVDEIANCVGSIRALMIELGEI